MNFLFTSAALLHQEGWKYLELTLQKPRVFTRHGNGDLFSFVGLSTGQHNAQDEGHLDDSKFSLTYHGVLCACASLSEVDARHASDAARELLHHYTSSKVIGIDQKLVPSEYSCMLFDPRSDMIWLTTDAVGAIPLWYGFEESPIFSTTDEVGNFQFVISTDLLLSHHVGAFPDCCTSLGPGQLMSVNASSGEVLSLVHLESESIAYDTRTYHTKHPEMYAGRLLSAAMNSLVPFSIPPQCIVRTDCKSGGLYSLVKNRTSTSPNTSDKISSSTCALNHSSIDSSIDCGRGSDSSSNSSSGSSSDSSSSLLLVVDAMDPASLLLECAAEALHLDRSIRIAQPIVSSGFDGEHRPQLYADILDMLPESFMGESVWHVRKSSFSGVATAAWQTCEAAAASLSDGTSLATAPVHKVLLSSAVGGVHMGSTGASSSSPEAVYLQNLFCRLLGVQVEYPFADRTVQQSLWSTDHPRAMLKEAVNLLWSGLGSGSYSSTICRPPSRVGTHPSAVPHSYSRTSFSGAANIVPGGPSGSGCSAVPGGSSDSGDSGVSGDPSGSGGSGVPGHTHFDHDVQLGLRRATLDALTVPCRGSACIDLVHRYSQDAAPSERCELAPVVDTHTAEATAANKNSIPLHISPESTAGLLSESVSRTTHADASFIGLWDLARRYASQDGIVLLLLATRGYAEMLANHLCSAQRLSQPFKNVIVITADDAICDIADQFMIGCFHRLHWSTISGGNTSGGVDAADFGSVSYQQLMLFRTETALQLLLLGFRPIIADIDTVWRRNPIDFLPRSFFFTRASLSRESSRPSEPLTSTSSSSSSRKSHGHGNSNSNSASEHQRRLLARQYGWTEPNNDSVYDIAITDDHGQVCGCFVALSSGRSDNAMLFWQEVTRRHRTLVSNAEAAGKLGRFDESEQMIITELLYGKQYTGPLNVWQLPKEMFPSGKEYFNSGKYHHGVSHPKIELGLESNTGVIGGSLPEPAIIHNNFLVGKEMKKARFQRYGLWNVRLNEAPLPPGRGRGLFASEGVAKTKRPKVECGVDLLDPWRAAFTPLSPVAPTSAAATEDIIWVDRDVSIPSLTMVLPQHNSELDSSIDHSRSLMFLATLENVPSGVLSSTASTTASTTREGSTRGDKTSNDDVSILLYTESEPPRATHFHAVAVGTMAIPADYLTAQLPITATLPDELKEKLVLGLMGAGAGTEQEEELRFALGSIAVSADVRIPSSASKTNDSGAVGSGSIFGIDRGGQFFDQATAVVLANQRMNACGCGGGGVGGGSAGNGDARTGSGLDDKFKSECTRPRHDRHPTPPYLEAPYPSSRYYDNRHRAEQEQRQPHTSPGGRDDNDGDTTFDDKTTNNPFASLDDNLELEFIVKVITYNRPESLSRLLESLNAAAYGLRDGSVPLEIIIDAAATQQDLPAVQSTKGVAEAFEWKHGVKMLRVRSSNVGLAQQWFDVWIPEFSLPERASVNNQALERETEMERIANRTAVIERVRAGERQACFVFEDDVEVSPYYFLWAVRAVTHYYAQNWQQRRLHRELLAAVRMHVAYNGSASSWSSSSSEAKTGVGTGAETEVEAGFEADPSASHAAPLPGSTSSPTKIGTLAQAQAEAEADAHDISQRGNNRNERHDDNGKEISYTEQGRLTPLQAFARRAAGMPLSYGVCLQRQHLDPNHYPKRLHVRNAHRPFLYSLVGSWGPLLLPLPWQAFREWWLWRVTVARQQLQRRSVGQDDGDLTGVLPTTEGLVVNHFVRSNPRIWTPYHVRFAYETGMKCLYTNFPFNKALIVNHREAGENYAAAQGVDADLLTKDSFSLLLSMPSSSASSSTSASASEQRSNTSSSSSTYEPRLELRVSDAAIFSRLDKDAPLLRSFNPQQQQQQQQQQPQQPKQLQQPDNCPQKGDSAEAWGVSGALCEVSQHAGIIIRSGGSVPPPPLLFTVRASASPAGGKSGSIQDGSGDVYHEYQQQKEEKQERRLALATQQLRLLWSFMHLPSTSELAGWQYDFNLRRAGALGSEAAHIPALLREHVGAMESAAGHCARLQRLPPSKVGLGTTATDASAAEASAAEASAEHREVLLVLCEIEEFMAVWGQNSSSDQYQHQQHVWQQSIEVGAEVKAGPRAGTGKTGGSEPKASAATGLGERRGTRLSSVHWLEVSEILQAHLAPSSAALHLHPSPLLPLLTRRSAQRDHMQYKEHQRQLKEPEHNDDKEKKLYGTQNGTEGTWNFNMRDTALHTLYVPSYSRCISNPATEGSCQESCVADTAAARKGAAKGLGVDVDIASDIDIDVGFDVVGSLASVRSQRFSLAILDLSQLAKKQGPALDVCSSRHYDNASSMSSGNDCGGTAPGNDCGGNAPGGGGSGGSGGGDDTAPGGDDGGTAPGNDGGDTAPDSGGGDFATDPYHNNSVVTGMLGTLTYPVDYLLVLTPEACPAAPSDLTIQFSVIELEAQPAGNCTAGNLGKQAFYHEDPLLQGGCGAKADPVTNRVERQSAVFVRYAVVEDMCASSSSSSSSGTGEQPRDGGAILYRVVKQVRTFREASGRSCSNSNTITTSATVNVRRFAVSRQGLGGVTCRTTSLLSDGVTQ